MSTCGFPLLSVIIATYNAQETLFTAMQSIIEQSFMDYEVLIVDGGSTDQTLNVASEFLSDRVSIRSEPDYGIYDAWNKGVRRAKGEWLLFMGADDKLADRDCLLNFVQACETMDLFGSHDIIYGDLVVLGNDGNPMDRLGRRWENPWSLRKRYLTADFPIPIMASFFRRKRVIASGAFSLEFKIISDIELVIRISKITAPAYVPNHALTVMGYGGISTNPRRALNLLKESFKVRRRHKLGTFTNLGFLHLSLKQLAKYGIARCFGTHASSVVISAYQHVKKCKASHRLGGK